MITYCIRKGILCSYVRIELTNLLCYIDLIVNRYTDIVINQLVLCSYIHANGEIKTVNTRPKLTPTEFLTQVAASKPLDLIHGLLDSPSTCS